MQLEEVKPLHNLTPFWESPRRVKEWVELLNNMPIPLTPKELQPPLHIVCA